MIKVGSNNLAILKSVSWIKHNFEKAVLIEDIAGMVNMSVSAFHRLFKTVTEFSPLQYQKRVRLSEARHLLLSEGQNVSPAAYSIGYESYSQFVSEYKRLFGQPPLKGIRTKSDSVNSPGKSPWKYRVKNYETVLACWVPKGSRDQLHLNPHKQKHSINCLRALSLEDQRLKISSVYLIWVL